MGLGRGTLWGGLTGNDPEDIVWGNGAFQGDRTSRREVFFLRSFLPGVYEMTLKRKMTKWVSLLLFHLVPLLWSQTSCRGPTSPPISSLIHPPSFPCFWPFFFSSLAFFIYCMTYIWFCQAWEISWWQWILMSLSCGICSLSECCASGLCCFLDFL